MIKRASCCFCAAWLLIGLSPGAIHGQTQDDSSRGLFLLRDRMWVWGNPEVTDQGRHSLATFCNANPAERARLLGVPNIIMAGAALPDNEEEGNRLTRQVAGFKRLVWETRPDGPGIGPPFLYRDRMAQVRRLAAGYPQIEGVLLDDLSTGKMDRGFKAEHVRHIRRELADCAPRLKVWGVVYSMSLGRDGLADSIRELDVINLWVWHAKDVVKLEKYVANIETQFPGKPIVLGLYLYDYGGGQEFPLELLARQCETALRLAHAGRIAGIVFLTINNDPKAVSWAADWIKREGGQEVRTPIAQRRPPASDPLQHVPGGFPSWIEGSDDTILRATSNDGKVEIDISRDEGCRWERLSTIQQPDTKLEAGYFTRLSRTTLVLTLNEPGHRICWVASDDNGRTWSSPTPIIATTGTRGGFGPVCVMTDGRWAFCLNDERTVNGSREFMALFVWSKDQGRTWSNPVVFPTPEDGNLGLTEATLVQLGPDDFLAAIRADESPTSKDAFDGFYLSRSKDGLTWSTPVSLGERGRMPLFYRIGDLWALAYRQYDCAHATQHSAIRFSRDGHAWSEPFVVETGVNAGPQLVQINGRILAFNNCYPDRKIGTRNTVTIPDWVHRQIDRK